MLVAVNGRDGTVLAWQWCDTEKKAAWKALLEQVPPPCVVGTDGGSGLTSALRECWPASRVKERSSFTSKKNSTGSRSTPRPTSSKAAPTPASKPCCANTGECQPTTDVARVNGGATNTPPIPYHHEP
ncbi:hypothetical protein GCM10010407_19240 [Rarobacter incanus]